MSLAYYKDLAPSIHLNMKSEARAVPPVPQQNSNQPQPPRDHRAQLAHHREPPSVSRTSRRPRSVAPNPISIVEAHYLEDTWIRAIYADETTIGFLTIAIWPPTHGYYIWRFMIDLRYQGPSFGRKVVRMAISTSKMRILRPSVHSERGNIDVEAQHSPDEFYVKMGFRQTAGPDEDGEVIMMVVCNSVANGDGVY